MIFLDINPTIWYNLCADVPTVRSFTRGLIGYSFVVCIDIKKKIMKGVPLSMHLHNFGAFSDEELVKMAQHGDQDALECIILRYKNLVCSKSKSFFLAGADEDDIIQEGLIGLYNAVLKFNGDRFPFFKVFASICVKRRMISAVKEASRKKHSPLNSYISLDNGSFDDDESTPLGELLSDGEIQNPETILIDRENMNGMEYKLNKNLSKFELAVLYCHLDGLSYREISKKLHRNVKAVDNAIQRIKKKLLRLGHL